MRVARSVLVLACVFAIGCGGGIALTDSGATVERLERQEMPAGCRMVADVTIGIPPDAARPSTEEQLVMLMRNKAGERGANRVVVEWTEPRTTASKTHWVGGGTAYACDPSAAGSGPVEPAEPSNPVEDSEIPPGDE